MFFLVKHLISFLFYLSIYILYIFYNWSADNELQSDPQKLQSDPSINQSINIYYLSINKYMYLYISIYVIYQRGRFSRRCSRLGTWPCAFDKFFINSPSIFDKWYVSYLSIYFVSGQENPYISYISLFLIYISIIYLSIYHNATYQSLYLSYIHFEIYLS